MDGLRNSIRKCRKCPLGDLQQSIRRDLPAVPSEGSVSASIIIVGQNPNLTAHTLGVPFPRETQAGRWINRLLADVGLARDNTYITNIVKCAHSRKPDVGPANQAREICTSHWLKREKFLLNPQVVIPIGKLAISHLSKTAFGESLTITSFRLKFGLSATDAKGISWLPFYHPTVKHDEHARSESGRALYQELVETLRGLLTTKGLVPASSDSSLRSE